MSNPLMQPQRFPNNPNRTDWLTVPIKSYQTTEKGLTVEAYVLRPTGPNNVVKVWLPAGHHALLTDEKTVRIAPWLAVAKNAELFTKGLIAEGGGLLVVVPFTERDVEKHRAYIATLKANA